MHTAAHTRTYLTPAEAAVYLSITTRALTSWRRSGSGPRYVRLGGLTGRVRYERATLDEYMRARQHTQTAAERSSALDTA